MDPDSLLFPHKEVRAVQKELLAAIQKGIDAKRNLVIHAPTGLGKTASSLPVALKKALEEDLVVFFLTSRHTQHQIALDTLQLIKEKFNLHFGVVSLIGKKGLCLQPGVQSLTAKNFHEFCRAMREDKKCEYYERMKTKETASPEAELALHDLEQGTMGSTRVIEVAEQRQLCPYELSLLLAKRAKVIVGDYLYLFSPTIRTSLLAKLGRQLDQCIVIVDEAHNLPTRIKDVSSEFLTSFMLTRSKQEAEKYISEELQQQIEQIETTLSNLAQTLNKDNERYITKEDLISTLPFDIDTFIETCETAGDSIREEQRQSFIGSLALFFAAWLGEDKGYTRILAKKQGSKGDYLSLSYRSLDPSIVGAEVFTNCYSSVLMSGTLTPTTMYQELLGVDGQCQEFESPFPQDNKLSLVIPKTTTKYSKRTPEMYRSIANTINELAEDIKGNIAVFFPSYAVMGEIYTICSTLLKKTIFLEQRNMTKTEKEEFLERFKQYNKEGAVLFGAITGSFGEGIDLPGDLLHGVIIVGLPLQKPDLETEALIKYYDEKFGKGNEYGYTYPSFQRTLQGAGRCIRSETDRGVVIFLDERYSWPNYYRCFPNEYNIRTTLLYRKMIQEFFKTTE
ncbi:hypothetical protein CMO92_03540 [Candidatus Woesearchaeota archaeon]|nr:hypothetical protein [Candidatus Woesearchaeota archaeon]